MAYEKKKWYDHVVERPDTYRAAENEDGSVTFTPDPLEVIQEGTAQSAANFNRLEEGLQAVSATVDFLTTLVDALDMQGQDKEEQMSQAVKDAQAALTEKLEAMQTALSQQIANQGTALGEKIDSKSAALEKKVADQGTALSGKIDSKSTALEKQITDQGTALGEKIDSKSTALEKQITDQGTALSTKLDNLGTDLSKKITAWGTSATNQINTVNRRITDNHRTATGTLAATGWEGSGPYTQKMAIAWMLETDMPKVTAVLSQDTETALKQVDAWCCVSKGEAGKGYALFTCLTYKPETDIPLQIEVNR